MYNESQLKVASWILKNKVFSYQKETGLLSGFKFYYTAKVTGQRVMYSMGEPYHTIQLDVEVVKISGPTAFPLIKNRKGKIFNRVEMIEERSLSGFDYVMRNIASQIAEMFKIFDSNVRAQVENLKISENIEVEDPLYPYQITEARVPRIAIRNVIKDIITLLKKNQEGEFNLPYDISGNDFYEFMGFPEFNVLIEIVHTDFENIPNGADFHIESSYVLGENEIQIMMRVFPERLEKSLFGIIGKLNDDIAHELQHLRQEDEGRLEDENDAESTKDYFLQPSEVEAQYNGFKRAAKSMGLTIEELVDEYFTNNQERFSLTDEDVEEIKDTILSFPKSY